MGSAGWVTIVQSGRVKKNTEDTNTVTTDAKVQHTHPCPNCEAAAQEMDKLRAELDDLYLIHKAMQDERDDLEAEADRMRPIVEAAIEYMITVERYDATGVHRTGKGSRARIRQAVSEYLKRSEEDCDA